MDEGDDGAVSLPLPSTAVDDRSALMREISFSRSRTRSNNDWRSTTSGETGGGISVLDIEEGEEVEAAGTPRSIRLEAKDW